MPVVYWQKRMLNRLSVTVNSRNFGSACRELLAIWEPAFE
jgi:hypothetical protein